MFTHRSYIPAGEPYTCFDASQYGTLLIVDPEEEFFPEEIEKLRLDVEERGLSVGVFADWYNTDVMKKIRFYDENTRQWWTPVTGGANVPALNDLLSPFGIAFADKVYDGRISISNPPVAVNFASGTSIARFPTGGLLFAAQLQDQTAQIVRDDNDVKREVAVVGLRPSASKTQGRIVAYGDSSCLDDAHKQLFCADLVHQLLEYVLSGFVFYYIALFRLRLVLSAGSSLRVCCTTARCRSSRASPPTLCPRWTAYRCGSRAATWRAFPRSLTSDLSVPRLPSKRSTAPTKWSSRSSHYTTLLRVCSTLTARKMAVAQRREPRKTAGNRLDHYRTGVPILCRTPSSRSLWWRSSPSRCARGVIGKATSACPCEVCFFFFSPFVTL